MRPRTQKKPQVKKEPCRVLDDVDVDMTSDCPGENPTQDHNKILTRILRIILLQDPIG